MEQPSSLPKFEETDRSSMNSSVEFPRASAFTAAKISTGEFAQATHDLLMEDSVTKRAAAARKLGGLGLPSASPYLIASLFDSSPEVRQAAVESLGQVGDSASLEPLQDLLARETAGGVAPVSISGAIRSIVARESKVVETEPMEASRQGENRLHFNNLPREWSVQPNGASGMSQPYATQEERLLSEEVALRKAQEDLERRRAEAERLHLAQEEKQQLATLEVNRHQAESDKRQTNEKERKLSPEIEALRRAESEQLKRINEANAKARRSFVEEDPQQPETEYRVRGTKETQRLPEVLSRAEAEAKLRPQEKAREEVKSKARRQSDEHVQRFAELEAIRSSAEATAQKRAEAEQRLSAEIAALRKAETEARRRAEEEVTRLAQLEVARSAAEAEILLRAAEEQRLNTEIQTVSEAAEEQIKRMEEAKDRLSALEDTRHRAELKVRQRAERELRLQAEIEALRQSKMEQTKRIEEAEAEAVRLNEEEARLKQSIEAHQKAQAEARVQVAEETRLQAEMETRRRAEEEERRLEKLEALRGQAEAAAQRRAEKEQQLSSEMEALNDAAAEQLERIEKVEADLRKAQAKARQRAEEETRLLAAREALQKAETEARRQAAEKERVQAQAEVRARAEDEKQRIAGLEAIRSKAEAEAQQRAEVEQQLNAGIEALRRAEANQVKRIEEAQAEARRLADQEIRRWAEEEVRIQAEAEARRRDVEQELRREEARVQTQTEEEQQRVAQLEAINSAAKIESQQRSEKMQRLNAELEALRKAGEEQSQRMEEAQARLCEVEAEACLKAEEEEQRLRDLEAIRGQFAVTAKQRLEREQQLNAEIQALIGRIEEAEAAIRAGEEALRSAEAELRSHAAEEERQLNQLEDIRKQAETQLQLKAEQTKELKAEIGALRKVEAKRLKEIEKLEARRSEAQAEARYQAGKETLLLEELVSIRGKIDLDAKTWAEKELSIKAEFEAVRKAEAVQLKRIEKAEARLQAQIESRGQAGAKAKGRGAKSQKGKTKSPAKGRASRIQREKDRVARLEAILSETAAELKRRTKKERLLHTKIQALCKTEVNQFKRIEEAKAHLRAQEEALGAQADEDARLLMEELSQQTGVEPTPLNQELVAAEWLLAPVNEETVTPKSTEEEHEFHAEIDAAVDSIRPVETWQFAVIDEQEVAVNDQEGPQPQTEAIEDDGAESQPLPFDLQAEPSILAEHASSLIAHGDDDVEASAEEEIDLGSDDWFVSAEVASEETFVSELSTEDFLKSIDLVEMEKGLQPADEESSTASALVERLKSGDPASRASALQKLAQLDEDDAFKLITNLFDDSSAAVRNAAARALYEFKPDHAASFTRALREASAERRRKIASALDGSGLAAEAINGLAGESREKTYDAFSILFLMAKAGEVQSLVKTIENHSNPTVQLSVIKLLTFSNQPDIIPAFRSLAVRGSIPPEVRSALMESINEISNNAREHTRSAA
ncbi:MAG: HEAT repeat domain-containing protein [Acidobacteriota bacterium]|nr:HEAT repeat domain-containing protein [Acidobacteriota bacterium]